MGYEDTGQGLRPGVGTIKSDMGLPNNLGTSYSGTSYGYRASGGQSANDTVATAPPSTVDTGLPSATGSNALQQYTAPEVQKSPGLLAQLGGTAAMQVGSQAVGNKFTDMFSSTPSAATIGSGSFALKNPGDTSTYTLNPSFASDVALSNPYSLLGGAASGSGVATGASLSGLTPGSSLSGLTPGSSLSSLSYNGLGAAPSEVGAGSSLTSAGTELPDFTSGLEAAGTGLAVGYVSKALGANSHISGAMGGAAAGFAVGGPIGAGIGAVVGGSVICTELVRQNDAFELDLRIEMEYVLTLSDATVRGYRFWAVPLVKIMRKNAAVYRFVRPIAKRFMSESAARVGKGKQTLLGRILMPIGLSVCWMIGQLVGETEFYSLYEKGELQCR
jgi:hypothetical protein